MLSIFLSIIYNTEKHDLFQTFFSLYSALNTTEIIMALKKKLPKPMTGYGT